jgi:hypothetical protein
MAQGPASESRYRISAFYFPLITKLIGRNRPHMIHLGVCNKFIKQVFLQIFQNQNQYHQVKTFIKTGFSPCLKSTHSLWIQDLN